MIVYLIPIVDKKKPKRLWLVSRSGAKQLRGEVDEKLPALQEQWEQNWGEIDDLRRERGMTTREAVEFIDGLRRKHIERKGT